MSGKKEVAGLSVASRVKEYLAGQELRTSGGLLDGEDGAEGLNAKIAAILDQAAARCKGNGRQTVKAYDL